MATSSSQRGFLLILNVERDRDGSKLDKENLKSVFEEMGADVVECDNPKQKEIKQKMAELMKKDFTNYLYCAVALFTHGTENDVVRTASEHELINSQKSILIPLCNNESLNGKLKWLIMQHCRGSYDFMKEVPEGPSPVVKYPAYCAKFFATSRSTKAYRTKDGSFFITALCERLRMHYKTLDLMSIFENTKLDVQYICERNNKINFIQCPEPETNFGKKKFYLTSGFVKE